jgi:glyceraldehyde 3-phosphate dehydrogenase
VSYTILTVEIEKTGATIESVNAAFKSASESSLQGIIRYTDEELVSSDFIGDPASCILDSKTTNVIDGTLVTVQGWYDNEWGYASRCVDMLRFMGSRL